MIVRGWEARQRGGFGGARTGTDQRRCGSARPDTHARAIHTQREGEREAERHADRERARARERERERERDPAIVLLQRSFELSFRVVPLLARKIAAPTNECLYCMTVTYLSSKVSLPYDCETEW